MQTSKVTIVACLAGALALPLYAQPASPELQARALELLRRTIAEQQAAPAQSSVTSSAAQPKPAKAKASGKAHASTKSEPAAVPGDKTNGATSVVPSPAPAAPVVPQGPRTKQQRLMDLLELYKADKVTPAEYHAQRAKILAEP